MPRVAGFNVRASRYNGKLSGKELNSDYLSGMGSRHSGWKLVSEDPSGQLHGPADLCLKDKRQTEAGQKQLQPQLRRLPGRQAPGALPAQPDLLPFL